MCCAQDSIPACAPLPCGPHVPSCQHHHSLHQHLALPAWYQHPVLCAFLTVCCFYAGVVPAGSQLAQYSALSQPLQPHCSPAASWQQPLRWQQRQQQASLVRLQAPQSLRQARQETQASLPAAALCQVQQGPARLVSSAAATPAHRKHLAAWQQLQRRGSIALAVRAVVPARDCMRHTCCSIGPVAAAMTPAKAASTAHRGLCPPPAAAAA